VSDPVDPRLPVRRHAVPVREPRYAPRGRGPRISASHVLVVGLFLVFIVGAAGFVALALAPPSSPRPGPSGSLIAGASGNATTQPTVGPGESPALGESPGPGETSVPGDTPGPGETPGPTDTPGPDETPAPVADMAMPMVPVVDFWSADDGISLKELTAALEGNSSKWPQVIVGDADRDAIARALDITLGASVESGDLEQIRQKTREGYLGLVRASDLSPRVRALALGGASLVGQDRIGKLSQWPLIATVQAPVDAAWDADATWTLVAGGDMFLDRGVRNTTLEKGKGVHYPFDGGTARVTGHCTCSPSQQIPNELVPTVKRTGNDGIVREFVKRADLAIANLENPIPDSPDWHLSGTHFGGPPILLKMFPAAGIDLVSLANNHILDYGAAGIEMSRKNLEEAGIPFTGAGRNVKQAGEIGYLEANGRRIAIIACVDKSSKPAGFASEQSAGGLSCRKNFVLPRIAEAKQNADIVIVFPHWGVEYTRYPIDQQRKLANTWIDAGADIILGSHSHVYGGLEDIDGHAVVYSMGNFIFDQYWSTDTMESALTELTFQGSRLVQIRLHPYVILDQAQPNFLNPATDDGKGLLKEAREVADSLGW
jgi:poly-gamma-glutamate capsule biosynthesis protein CapA/YwtB (metallophosphatase superfamily)